jgi:hypothetical protein
MMRCARWQNLFCADLEKIVLKNIWLAFSFIL